MRNMKMSPSEYAALCDRANPRSPWGANLLRAFLTGGLICLLGEGLSVLYRALGAAKADAATYVSISLIALSALLTGLGLYERIARFGGAGSLVPITGFANAMTACAIEFKSEGFVLGVGANMFKIAGPVIVYGTAASVVYGVIYWLMQVL